MMKTVLSQREVEEKFDYVHWRKMLANADRAISKMSDFKNASSFKKEFQYIFGVLSQYFKEIKTGLECHRFVPFLFQEEWLKPFYLSIDLINVEEAKKPFTNISSAEKIEKKIEEVFENYTSLYDDCWKLRNLLKTEKIFDIAEVYEKIQKGFDILSARVAGRVLTDKSLLKKEYQIYYKMYFAIKPLIVRKHNFLKACKKNVQAINEAEFLLKGGFLEENKFWYMQKLKVCQSIFKNILRFSNAEDLILAGDDKQNKNMICLIEMHGEIILDILSKMKKECQNTKRDESWKNFEKQFSECSLQEERVVILQYTVGLKKERKKKYIEDLTERLFRSSEHVYLEEVMTLLKALKNDETKNLAPPKIPNMLPLRKEYADSFAYFLNRISYPELEEVKKCPLSP